MAKSIHIILLVALAFVFSSSAFGQGTEQDAVGLWLSENSNEKIEIYKKEDGKYYGRMVWMRNEYDAEGNRHVDKHNPDPKLRGRPMVGVEFILGFNYVGRGWFTGGEIYDMDSGNTYSARIYIQDENTARLRGYIGIPLFGRTEICSKVKE